MKIKYYVKLKKKKIKYISSSIDNCNCNIYVNAYINSRCQGEYCVFDHYYDVAVDSSSFNFIDREGTQRV